MNGSRKDQTVLVVGRGSGLAQAITLAERDEGAQVIAASRDSGALAATNTFLTGQTLHIDGGQPLT